MSELVATFAVAHLAELLGRPVLDFDLRGYGVPELRASLVAAERSGLVEGQRNAINQTVLWTATEAGRERVERVLCELASDLAPAIDIEREGR